MDLNLLNKDYKPRAAREEAVRKDGTFSSVGYLINIVGFALMSTFNSRFYSLNTFCKMALSSGYFESKCPNYWSLHDYVDFVSSDEVPRKRFGQNKSRFLNELAKIKKYSYLSVGAKSRIQSLMKTNHSSSRSKSKKVSLTIFLPISLPTGIGIQTSLYWDPRLNTLDVVGQSSGLLCCGQVLA